MLLFFAAYGLIRGLSDWYGARSGEKPGEAVKSLAAGAAVAAGEKMAEKIKQTPDQQLEENAQLLTKKLYPIAKGIIKGQVEAIVNDPERGDLPQKMFEAGKDVSEKIVKPFSRGLREGSSGLVGEGAQEALKKLRELGQDNKEWLDSVSRGLEKLHKDLKEKAPPLPPFPGPMTPPLMPPSPFGPPTEPSQPQQTPAR